MATKTNKKGATKKPRGKHGHFIPGNTVGKETRFQSGNILSKKYNDEYPEELLKYFREKVEAGEVPFLGKWADSKGIDIKTAETWAKDTEGEHARFSTVYAQCLELQKIALMSGGLSAKQHPRIVEFLLKNIHGMKEKVDAEVKGSGGLTINIHEVSNGNP